MTQENEIDYYFKWYKNQDFNSLSYCQLKEFRKFALWFQEQEIKRNQRQQELDNIETTRKRFEESYPARVKALDERENELQQKKSKLLLQQRKKSCCLVNTVNGLSDDS